MITSIHDQRRGWIVDGTILRAQMKRLKVVLLITKRLKYNDHAEIVIDHIIAGYEVGTILYGKHGAKVVSRWLNALPELLSKNPTKWEDIWLTDAYVCGSPHYREKRFRLFLLKCEMAVVIRSGKHEL